MIATLIDVCDVPIANKNEQSAAQQIATKVDRAKQRTPPLPIVLHDWRSLVAPRGRTTEKPHPLLRLSQSGGLSPVRMMPK
jgi:hypothetical protein